MKENKKEKNGNNDFYKGIFSGVFVIILIILAFIFGIKFGRHEINPRRLPPMMHPFFNKREDYFIPKRIPGHGLMGEVDSVSKKSFVVKDRLGELITVLVDEKTQYRIDSQKGSLSDIKKGKNVLVIGEPDNQELAIRALIIRIF